MFIILPQSELVCAGLVRADWAGLLSPWPAGSSAETGARAAASLGAPSALPALREAWPQRGSVHPPLLCLRPGPSAEPPGGGRDRTAAASAGPPPPGRQGVEGAATRLGVLCLQSISRPTWFFAAQASALGVSRCARLVPGPLGCGGSTQAISAQVHNATCQRPQSLGLVQSPMRTVTLRDCFVEEAGRSQARKRGQLLEAECPQVRTAPPSIHTLAPRAP